MSVRPIIVIPNSQLRTSSKALEQVDEGARKLIDDLFDTMYDAEGVGLAAIQVAVPQRVIVIDAAREGEDKQPLALINPEIVWSSAEQKLYREGCLSIPEYYEEVTRPARVKVNFLDRNGGACELDADGLLATVLQHEIDHLNGVLFIDHISRLKRERVWKKFVKAARAVNEPAPARMGGRRV